MNGASVKRSDAFRWTALLVLALLSWWESRADEAAIAIRFREEVQPILETYCYGCHGYGAAEGNRTLDEFESDKALVENISLWHAVLKNVRAGVMPPPGEEQPDADERQKLIDWIKFGVFGIDPKNPDPGRVTLRRLNRIEYRNTIRDLMGVDYDTQELFPADDSGYGFDNIGDVLSMSPLLLEKYLKAAEAIVDEAVPKVSRVVGEKRIGGRGFLNPDRSRSGDRMSFYTPIVVTRQFHARHDGKYHFDVDLELDGSFEFDPARCRMTFKVDDTKIHEEEFRWADRESRRIEVDCELKLGLRSLAFELEPLVPIEKRLNDMDLRIRDVTITGPLEPEHWVEPRNYRRFFPEGEAPTAQAARDDYAREVLAHFCRRAYRRPAEKEHLDRLVSIAKATYEREDETFETGVAQAMIAVLASPRFLFRIEDVADLATDKYPLLDEHALASRLSYFLWSTMPDDELFSLADRGELRANLSAQVNRMVADQRSSQFVEHFAGQWLRARDVEHSVVYPIVVLGLSDEHEKVRAEFRKLRRSEEGRRRRNRRDKRPDDDPVSENESDEQKAARERQAKKRAQRREQIEQLKEEIARFDQVREMFSRPLRVAMRRETEMALDYVMRKDRSVLELIDADYTFLNDVLAKHYGVEGIEGDQMRRVELPKESERGGVLTQGTFLVVTSNPTRTSPVKRGLFVLENILGMPPPPPPASVPPLEKSAEGITDHEPTNRELLEIHRKEPLCRSCHARMDPLGLALENFNALGMLRESENGRPIDTSGELLTGEKFNGISNLKRIITSGHRQAFYRCLTEKMLIYALGRGLEYHDEHTVDQIVEKLEANEGTFSTLLTEIVNAAPFQRVRRVEVEPTE
jgi:hypothetical protein